MTLSAIFYKSRHLAGDFFRVKVSFGSFFYVTDFGDTLDEVVQDVNTLRARRYSPPFPFPLQQIPQLLHMMFNSP